MSFTILVEKLSDYHFRAHGGAATDLTFDGPTADEALNGLRAAIDARLARGDRFVSLEIEERPNPWKKHAGMFANDPAFAKVVEIMNQNRRHDNADPDYF